MLTQRRIARFWSPLAATWLMMAAEGPFLAALIARLADPTFNLAAFGVAFSFAMFIEAPIIMVLSAATALVRDRRSFLALRRFVYGANAAITATMLVLVAPPVFRFLARELIGLPPEVARLAHLATALLLPWPAAIGYRRFYQGVLIRHNLTRLVAAGTVVRLVSMAGTGGLLFAATRLPGVIVAASALSAGVLAEAAASRLMARRIVDRLRRQEGGEGLTLGTIAAFYVPLALTSMITLGVQPIVTFFLGHARAPVASLALLPVVNALVFIFRSPGFAFQEVGIALVGEGTRERAALARFAASLGAATSLALAVVAWTPLATVWLEGISGLSAGLAGLAVAPLRILALLPGLEVLLSFQRAMLVSVGATRLVTWATAIEMGGIVALLAAGTGPLALAGIVAAAFAALGGRLAANLFLALRR